MIVLIVLVGNFMINEVHRRIKINIGYMRKILNITHEDLTKKCMISVS